MIAENCNLANHWPTTLTFLFSFKKIVKNRKDAAVIRVNPFKTVNTMFPGVDYLGKYPKYLEIWESNLFIGVSNLKYLGI